jgi:hypothetical protein
MKAEAINILRERAADAGLTNVSAEVGRIEDYRCFLSPQRLLLCCFVPTHRISGRHVMRGWKVPQGVL